jgi:transcriptional regulator with PAS, ATPase and Fis domain
MQEKEVMRIGDDKIISVNCRIISATNKDLRKKVQQGEFREDLYYRLDVFHIQVPPLRRRKRTSPSCARAFWRSWASPSTKNRGPRSTRCLSRSRHTTGPATCGSCSNICQRIALLLQATTGNLEIRKVLRDIINVQFPEAEDVLPIRVNLEKGLKHAAVQAEKQIIQAMLDRYEGSQTAVMEKLGIGRTTLWRKLNDSDPPPCDGPCHQEQ